jgi:hypothetical protein
MPASIIPIIWLALVLAWFGYNIILGADIKILDPDKFCKISSGLQSIIIATGILIGGIWTFYTYTYSQNEQHEKMIKEEARIQAKELALRSNIEVSLDANYVYRNGCNYIYGTIHILNHGTSPSSLHINNNSVTLTRVDKDKDGNTHYILIDKSFIQEFSGTMIDFSKNPNNDFAEMFAYPGTENNGFFLFPVSQPGLYIVSFNAPMGSDEIKDARNFGAVKEHLEWRATKLLDISGT